MYFLKPEHADAIAKTLIALYREIYGAQVAGACQETNYKAGALRWNTAWLTADPDDSSTDAEKSIGCFR